MHLLWLAFFPIALSALVNVSIDNKFGDPITGALFSYSPNGAWFDEPGCLTCPTNVDPALAHDGTWINGTFNPQPGAVPFPNVVLTASINFTGTALYVFCIIANDEETHLTFFLDGDQVGVYNNTPNGTPGYQYNVTVYANHSIPDGLHSFTLQNGKMSVAKSVVLFDYLVYTSNNASSSSHSGLPGVTPTESSGSHSGTSSRGKIVGAIFGTIGAALLIALAIVSFGCKQRKRSRLPLAKVRLPFKLPQNLFRRRPASAAPPTARHSFNPTLLVQSVAPDPPIVQTFPPHPYTLPPHDNRIPSSSAWAGRRLEPQRRQDSDISVGRADRGPVVDIQKQKRGNSHGRGNSHQPQYDESVDLSSHYDDSAGSNPPPQPSPPPLRRFTVRNN